MRRFQFIRKMKKKPTKASETFPMDGGGFIHIDRRIMPIYLKCDHCDKKSPNWAYDEDESVWCLECIEEWEKKNSCHWADGKPFDEY